MPLFDHLFDPLFSLFVLLDLLKDNSPSLLWRQTPRRQLPSMRKDLFQLSLLPVLRLPMSEDLLDKASVIGLG